MNNNAEEIKKAFYEQFQQLENNNIKQQKFKTILLDSAFVIAFLFVLTGAIISYNNYRTAKNKMDNNTVVIQKVVVKEY